MKKRHFLLISLIATFGLLQISGTSLAQGKKSDSVVKAEIKAGRPGGDGKQELAVTLTIDPKYHIYANPVGNEDFSSNQTTLSVTGKNADEAKVEYPEGVTKKDGIVGDYKIYHGKVTLKALVQRSAGGNSPLEVKVKIQACSDKTCLMPATITLMVP
ncbi:MAG: protein-disulfide reductase DsbD N-terminal domain-containing protein [Gemmataceae bacterium]